MKLQELGLKSKPQTKYFTHGYVSFQTSDDELFYEVEHVSLQSKGTIDGGKVMNKEHFDMLMNVKTIEEFIQA